MRHAGPRRRSCRLRQVDIDSLRRSRQPVLLQHLLLVGRDAKRAMVQPEDVGVAVLQPARLLAGSYTAQRLFTSASNLQLLQVAYTGSLRSSAITLDYFQNQCNVAFGRKMTQDTDAFNAKYGGFTPNATRVIALNGRHDPPARASAMCSSLTAQCSDDPWRRTCVKRSLNPLYVENTATCDGCGHCGDLRAPSPSEAPAITAQHAFVDTYVGAWIKAAAQERGI